MKIGQRYAITWLDIQSFAEWHTKADALKLTPATIDAVYIYVGSTRTSYIFAGEQNQQDYGNITVIPKGCIKKVKPIK